MMIRKLITGIIIISEITIAKAQHATTSSGGDAFGNGGSVAYSIGQVDYISNIGTTGKVNQGVEQPFEITSVGIEDEFTLKDSPDIFPNPTLNYLTLNIKKIPSKNLSYELWDALGKLLECKTITTDQTQIIMDYLPSATYYINLIEENKTIKSFRVIKTNQR